MTGSNRTLALSELAALGPPGTAAGAGVAAAPQPPPTTTSGNGSTSSGPIPAPTEMPVGKNSPTTPITVQCDAPRAAIDKPSPTCGERWQTAIFRANVPKVFFAANEYIDRWQAAADTGDELVEYVATLAELAVFADSVMGVKGGVAKAAQIIIKGNSSLLMLGFALPEQTLGVTIAREAVDAVRSGVEAIVEQQLRQPGGVINPWTVAPKVVTLANSLLSYANTVRYSRLRNTYTLALQYLRLLYRMGGDQTAFAQSLGLAANASVQDCLSAVNRRSFGFPTQLTDAGAFNATLAEKVVNHWVTAISEYAALKEQ